MKIDHRTPGSRFLARPPHSLDKFVPWYGFDFFCPPPIPPVGRMLLATCRNPRQGAPSTLSFFKAGFLDLERNGIWRNAEGEMNAWIKKDRKHFADGLQGTATSREPLCGPSPQWSTFTPRIWSATGTPNPPAWLSLKSQTARTRAATKRRKRRRRRAGGGGRGVTRKKKIGHIPGIYIYIISPRPKPF